MSGWPSKVSWPQLDWEEMCEVPVLGLVPFPVALTGFFLSGRQRPVLSLLNAL